MSGRVIALALAALVVVPSATPQVVVATTIFRTVNLRQDAITAFKVACPPGYLPVSAGVSTPAPGTTTLGIRPTGQRGYTFRIGNPSSNPARLVTVAASCRRVPAVSPKTPALTLSQVKTKPIAVPAGGQKTVTLPCPSRTLAAGSGLDLDPGRSGGSAPHFGGTSLSVRRLTGTLKAFTLGIRNTGSATRSAVLYGSCLTLVRPAGAPRERLQVNVTTWTTPLRPGGQVVSKRCGRGWFSLGTGYTLPPVVRLGGSAAISGGGRWALTNGASVRTLTDVQLVCGRLLFG
jgi:hypothetical protein